MCGRYGFSVKDAREVYDRFGVMNKLGDFQPRYNIAPGQYNPVLLRHSPTSIERMFWGLIPHWSKDETMKWKTINARSETAATSPSYHKPFRFQRCLVPATNFYEWDKSQKPSTPYCIKLKHEDLFAFAGLYDIWHDPKTGKDIYSYTILTCPPNDLIAPIHNRMPVILKREGEDTWLNPDIVEPEQLQPLLIPYPEQEMELYSITTTINYPKNDREDVLQPATP